jgi:hypothetical protein
MFSFRGQASSAKMTSHGSKLTALACHPTKSVNKAEELTYLSTNIESNICKQGWSLPEWSRYMTQLQWLDDNLARKY